MGEMADFANEDRFTEWECFQTYQHSPLSVQYEEGVINEDGSTIGNSSALPFGESEFSSKGPHGDGICPKCGASTIKKRGKFGEFYGCSKFPKCNGSRGI